MQNLNSELQRLLSCHKKVQHHKEKRRLWLKPHWLQRLIFLGRKKDQKSVGHNFDVIPSKVSTY